MATDGTGRVERDWNADWRFAEGPHAGAEDPAFDDRAWQAVRLPHDWAVAKPFDPDGDPGTGKLPWRGEGWYRKHLPLASDCAGKRVVLEFGGVMAEPKVYANGALAGWWDCGYSSFHVDITDHLRAGEDNVIAVHADTRRHGSRWYPGAGIYRSVRLIVTEPVHIVPWGIRVTTPEVRDDAATVEVETTISNDNEEPVLAQVETVLLAPDGREVARRLTALPVTARGSASTVASLEVPSPRRWDVDDPALYAAIVSVRVDGAPLDSVRQPFGIRVAEFRGPEGFHLNGRRVQLKGVNLHHDHGALGAAFYPRAMERQFETMREMGCNAIRTSHNPPAPGLLDLCDRMGLLVIDELADSWWACNDFHGPDEEFAEHYERNAASLVRRDRNHPCVVLWSMGNEITAIERNDAGDAREKVALVASLLRRHDGTRPVTLERCIGESLALRLEDYVDVESWHYGETFLRAHEAFPELPVTQSESASCFSTRGFYDPPLATEKTAFSPTRQMCSYDHTSAAWGDIADVEFLRCERHPWLAGEFVWTGFDYLGEPTPVAGEFLGRQLTNRESARSSFFGIVDLAGIPKDRYYLYRSHWAPETTTVHILPHWNWEGREGQTIPVYVYTNGDEAELFLNGRSLGRRRKLSLEELGDERERAYHAVLDRYRLRWLDVAYEPGELRAVAYRGGEPIGEAAMRTAGPVAGLHLTPDRARLDADGMDLCYVLVEARDAEGNLCPLADNPVGFTVEGPAEIAGVDNGDPHSLAPFQTSECRLFCGKAMLILRTVEGAAGHVTVLAESDGVAPCRCEVTSL